MNRSATSFSLVKRLLQCTPNSRKSDCSSHCFACNHCRASLTSRQAAVFVTDLGQRDKSYNLTFAVNTHDASPDDIWFYLRAPTSYQWAGMSISTSLIQTLRNSVAVGFGKYMRGALIFIVYPDEDGKSMVLSKLLYLFYC